MTKPANILAALLLMGASVCLAADKADKGQADQESTQKLQATVVKVTGQAEKLAAGKTDQWEALSSGDKLDELSVIRTGLRSSVTIKFADRGETIVGAATKVGIAEFRKKTEHATTRLGLKYGSLSVAVDSSRGTNDFKVATPVATLSVRGTKGDISYVGGDLTLSGKEGTWNVAGSGRQRNVGAGEGTDGNLTPPIDLAKQGRDSFRAVTGVTGGERTFIANYQPLLGAISLPGDMNLPFIPPSPNLPRDHITPGF